MNVTRTIDTLGLTGAINSEVEFVRRVERGLPVATVAEAMGARLVEQVLGRIAYGTFA